MRLLVSSIGILITVNTVISFIYCEYSARVAAIVFSIIFTIVGAFFTKFSYDEDEKTFINWVINLILGLFCILYAIIMSNIK